MEERLSTDNHPAPASFEELPPQALALFEATAAKSALLRADPPRYTILAATPSYLDMSGSAREQLVGRDIFDYFPSNPSDAEDTGALSLRTVLDTVVQTGQAQYLVAVRYDVTDAEGHFVERYWNVSNRPFPVNGETQYIIHTVEEATQQVMARRKPADIPNLAYAYELFMQAPVSVAMFTGEDLVVDMANAATLAYWHKDGSVIGKPLRDVLPHLTDHQYIHDLRTVLHTGQPREFKEAPLVVTRDGREETHYFNFVYKPYFPGGDPHPSGVLTIGIEVTEEVNTRKAVIESRRRLEESEIRSRSIIEHAPVATCFFLGRDLVIEVANNIMIDFWGKDASIIGKPLAEAVPELRGQPFLDILDRVFTTGETYVGRAEAAELRSGEGGTLRTRYFDFVYKPLFDAEGKVYGIMDMASDVTEQVHARRRIEDVVAERTHQLAEANEALHHSNRELQRSNHHLEEFAHAASHDLKEPIRKIQVFTDRLKSQLNEKLSDADQGLLDRIEKASGRMGLLVDDLLRYSHVSQRPHEMEEIDLNQKISRVLEDLELHIQEKGATVEVGPLPTIQGYRRQLQQLFQNLITNALKYNRAGVPPHIVITSAQAEEGGKRYNVIEVQDNGIGFEEQYKDKIFQMFTRLHGKHEYGGTGVGLSIVKKVVENHDGFIRVSSVVGEGSKFRIYL